MQDINRNVTMALIGFMMVIVVYEWLSGKYKEGRKTKNDWGMFALSTVGVVLVERPLLIYCALYLCQSLLPTHEGDWAWIYESYPVLTITGIVLIDEFLHGGAHNWVHAKKPKNKILGAIHSWYLGAHRPHHQNAGNDRRGEISATQAVVAGWGWAFGMPNAWFGILCVFMGLAEAVIIGSAIKYAWGVHVHANWRYDLYLLNHKNPLISKTMYALCHIFTFPNQHHQHHSRSKNSAKNMNNFLALFDWLFWRKLVIEYDRPAVYGWKQNEKEEASVIYRYFHRKI